jgi:hypothetical protein
MVAHGRYHDSPSEPRAPFWRQEGAERVYQFIVVVSIDEFVPASDFPVEHFTT